MTNLMKPFCFDLDQNGKCINISELETEEIEALIPFINAENLLTSMQNLYWTCLEQMRGTVASRYVEKAYFDVGQTKDLSAKIKAASENLRALEYWADCYNIRFSTAS